MHSFNSRDCYQDYLKSSVKETLYELCGTGDIIRRAPIEQILSTAVGFPSRPESSSIGPGNHVAMAKIQYAPGTRSEGLKHWKNVVASVEADEKEGTYTYWFLTDPRDDDVLYSVERYRDESYLWDVHVPSEAIQKNIEKQKSIRTGLLLRGFESVE